MSSSYFGSHLRRTTRNLLLTHVALLGVCAAMLRASARELSAMVAGPRPVGAAELARLARSDAGTGAYVTVRAEDMVEVGERWEERSAGERRVVAKLQLAKVGDHALLVETALGALGRTLSGRLEEMSPTERAELSGALRDDNPRLVNLVLPARLTTTKTVWTEDGWFVVLLAAGALLALWKIVQGIGRLRDPGTHPSMRALAPYGGMFANSNLIDSEVAAGPLAVGATQLTKSWLLHPATYSVHAAPIGDVVWYYKRVTKHYHNFIPAGKTFELVVHTGPAKQPLGISTKEKHVDRLLAELAARAPWAMAGYAKEIEQAMAGPQRAQLVKDVRERRRQAKSAA